jgi:hypothetical protein
MVDFQRVSIKKVNISKDDVTQFYIDYIYWLRNHSILLGPFPIMEYLTTNSRVSFIAMVWEEIARL